MRSRLAALVPLLALAAACATGPRAPSSPALAGSYALAEVNDRALPAESPTESGVTLHAGALALEADGRFTLRMNARTASQPAGTDAVVTGTYRLEGETLVVTHEGVSAPPMRFHLAREGATLRLRDDRGNEFTFSRR